MAAEEKIRAALSQLDSALKSDSLDTLSAKHFRVFIDSTRHNSDIAKDVLQEASDKLLLILSRCYFSNDTQIVIATAYSNVVTCHLQNTDDVYDHFIDLLRRLDKEIEAFICYAVLQLNNSFWTAPSNSKELLLKEIFIVIQEYCCDLKSTTYLVFKVLNKFLQKVHLNYPSGQGCPNDWFKRILKVVLANWENPLTGIRQINSLIFNQMLDFNQHIWETAVESEGFASKGLMKHECFLGLIFRELSWTVKSKYFLLSEVVSKTSVSQVMQSHGMELVNGLFTSLAVPHLVSAGTDLYCKVMENLSLTEWQQYFLPSFENVMTQKDISLESENIFNYWVPHTIKKLSVMDELLEVTGLNLYSFINLHRIARKEGFQCSLWETIDKMKLKSALQDFNDKIRSQAFSLVCVSSKTLSPPVEEEFILAKSFLSENVNSDNTALRQNLLNSFTNFVVRIRDSLLQAVKNNLLGNISPSFQCYSFLDWVHSFLLFNLQEGCNYQRKVTSLELYKVVLTYFGEPIKETSKNYKRKSNKNHHTLKDSPLWKFKYVSEESRTILQNCLFDEDNEIRSCAAFILVNYFKITYSHQEEFKDLFETGLDLCLSEVFYKAEGGALIITVLVSLAYSSSSETLKGVICKGGNNYISVLLSSCEKQFKRLQEDLLKAAVEKSFLYGSLQALNLLLTDHNSPEFMAIDKIQLERLLVLLEDVTKYFIAVLSTTSDPNSEYAPSFGEMGMAIKEVVDQSSLRCSEVTELSTNDTLSDLQLTPAQQLVLSCVWLNIKECTKLSSRLVAKPLAPEDVKRCVLLVVLVLRKCRHKGAIESAGIALYQITQQVTSSKNEQLVALPTQLMDEFLECLTGNTASTVSRRSAGLAILVHKLITGDNRPGKPLLHNCVHKLLFVVTNSYIKDVDNLVDLPQSQALHFLRTLVQESSLREHMAPYTLSIALLAVEKLASPLWTVRNAALQLFGALVPKLVGQKPHQEESTGHHFLPFEELCARARPLVDMMLSEFSSAVKENSSVQHSKLMPLLTLVTNLCVGLQTFVDKRVRNTVQQFITLFEHFLSSDIYNVRKLSAKAHSLFLTSAEIVPYICKRCEEIVEMIEGNEVGKKNENKVQGYLLNVVQLYNRFEEEKVGMKVLLIEEEKIKTVINIICQNVFSSKCSYFVKSLVFQLDFVKSDIVFGNTTKLDLGFSYFTNQLVYNQVLWSGENEIKDKVHLCLVESSSLDHKVPCMEALKQKMTDESFCKTNNDLLKELLMMLNKFAEVHFTDFSLLGLVLQNMLRILELLVSKEPSLMMESSSPQFIFEGLNILTSRENSTLALVSLLPVVCGVLATHKTKDVSLVEKLAVEIKRRSDSSFNQDVRVHAAKALLFLTQGLKFHEIEETIVGELIWESAVTFLQDEVTDVRYEASKFVKYFFYHEDERKHPLNPVISLDTLFELSSICQLMNTKTALKCLWRQLTCCSSVRSDFQEEIVNPFNHNTDSVYTEDQVMSHRAFLCLCELVRSLDPSEAKEIECMIKQNCDQVLVDKLSISSKTAQYIEELKQFCK